MLAKDVNVTPPIVYHALPNTAMSSYPYMLIAIHGNGAARGMQRYFKTFKEAKRAADAWGYPRYVIGKIQ